MDHTAAIARIEANTEAIVERLDRLNGKVAKHEASINDHALYHARSDGRRDGRRWSVERAVMLLTLAAVLWQAYSSDRQWRVSAVQPSAQAGTNGKVAR